MKFRSEGKWACWSVFSPQMYLAIGSAGKPQIPSRKADRLPNMFSERMFLSGDSSWKKVSEIDPCGCLFIFAS